MGNWAWLLLGAAGGFALARSGASVGSGLSFSVGAGVRGAPPGSGSIPLDQPAFGSTPYQTVGVWNAELPGMSFAEDIDNGERPAIVKGGQLV